MKFGKQFFTYGAADIGAKSIGLITSPIMVRLLSPEDYGVYPLLAAVWASIAWLQYIGMDSSMLAFRANDGSAEGRHRIMVTSTYIAVVGAILTWAIAAAIGLGTGWLQDYATTSYANILIFIVGMAPAGIVVWQINVFRFLHLPKSFAYVTLTFRVMGPLLAIFAIPLFKQWPRVSVFLCCMAFAQYLGILVASWEVRRNRLQLLKVKDFSFKLAIEMIRYGLPIVPGAVMGSLILVMDRLMLGYFGSTSDVAIYSLAVTIGGVALTLKTWFGLVFVPHLVDWIAYQKPKVFTDKLQNVLNIVAVVFFSISILAGIWGRMVIQFIYPESYWEATGLIPIICLTCAVSMLSVIAQSTIYITKKSHHYFMINLIGLATNFFVCILWIPGQKSLGAVKGTLFAELVMLVGWITVGKYILKNLNLSWRFSTIVGLASTGIVGLILRPSFEKNIELYQMLLASLAVILIGWLLSRRFLKNLPIRSVI